MINPSVPTLLPVSHLQQRKDGECLAACAAMVLPYIGVKSGYDQVVRLLDIHEFGVPFSNLRKLERLKISVTVEQRGTLQRLDALLKQNHPCIVAVDTGELAYWQNDQPPHAVVVIGLDQAYVYVQDPGWKTGPLRVPIGDFDLAWLNQDETYAFLAK